MSLSEHSPERTTDTDATAQQDSQETQQPAPATRTAQHRRDHWQLLGVAVFVSVGVAILTQRGALLLAAVVGVGLLAYSRVRTVKTPTLSVTRSIADRNPDPGDTVRVETTVRNLGESTLTDCRLVDQLPAELSVLEGSPRAGTVLRPGEAETISYTVRAQRGAHPFEGVYAIFSNLPGTSEHEYEFESEDLLRCSPTVRTLGSTLLRSMTTPYAGRLSTDKPGEGLEFHATREYRSGDPLRRIDWNQYASTGELATLQFRTERAAAVVVIADLRPGSYVRADQQHSHAADRCIEAASRLFVSFLADDHRAGLATFGPDFWLAPDTGSDHRRRGIDAIAGDPAFSPTRPSGTYPVRLRLRWLNRRLPEEAQVVLCSPLLDWSSETIVQILESYGHEVTVISPDPTGEETAGQKVARLERKNRIADIHRLGVPVVDWPVSQSLDVTLASAATGWSE